MATDFIYFLKKELAVRCEKNPAYSLRSFARHLQISHTTLSQVLSGKRPLTVKSQRQMALALGLSPKEIDQFHNPKGPTFDEKFEKMDLEHFELLAEWHHDAILELTHLKTFKPDCRWIALVLDLNVHQVELAVERLFKLGYLKLEKGGKWRDVSVNNTNNHVGDFTNMALRKYQKGLLQKSQNSLENVPREFRDHTSMMLHFSKTDLKRAKEMIREFRTELLNFAEKNKNPDEVYALSVSFFPLSHTGERKLI
jgi:transcriptional regulator with XRE-family HTH domain